MANTIISKFYSTWKPFKEIKTFSDKPGIYSVHFHGSVFPLSSAKEKVKSGDIVYIGKTLSSQKDRDADSHFSTGKTGSSTLRRTLGAILIDQLNLKPIPRSESETTRNRFRNYRFEKVGEERLTTWMTDNLGLSFHEVTGSPKEIEDLEKHLINLEIPILNLNDNRGNPWLQEILELRKNCALMAEQQYEKSGKTMRVAKSTKPKVIRSAGAISSAHKYDSIWRNGLKRINSCLKDGGGTISFDKNDFKRVGNRKSYSFNLEFKNGNVSNNIGGSAVARDLAKTLTNDLVFRIAAKGSFLRFRFDKNFVLNISKQ